jgi:hypothetical protein
MSAGMKINKSKGELKNQIEQLMTVALFQFQLHFALKIAERKCNFAHAS